MTAKKEEPNTLLERLRANPQLWLSGQDLCVALNCSRTAIWKQIKNLRHQGYLIEARPRLGYRLASSPEAPLPAEVLARLTTRTLGRHLLWLPDVDSTNRWLTEKADAGTPEGLAVTADTQTAGRGRLNRDWFSPPGLNLYASLLLRPDVPLDRVASLSILLGLAVRRAVRSLAPELEPRLKWPNDIWLGGRKLCGILCDMRAEPDRVRHVVAGIGMNVNTGLQDFPPALHATATSLRLAAHRSFSRAAVLAALLNALEPVYHEWVRTGLASFADELIEADLLKGHRITLSQGERTLEGRADGIAPDGSLLLAGRAGTTSVYSGDVHIESISGLKKRT
ncbi:MAG: biotin--[acetyl-CoA-carboxylase] ligase [Kiritimatiellia bacterium]